MRPSELLSQQIAERAIGPLGVVLDSPQFNQASGMTHGYKPVLVQAFIREAPAETLNIAVFQWLARPDGRHSEDRPI